jgi:large subunit ribosomal protein L24
MQKTKLKKGDAIKVIAGREEGKTGKILKVIGKENKIVLKNSI